MQLEETAREIVPEQRPVKTAVSVWGWLFSFPAFLSTVLAALTVLSVQDRLNDPDLWWHLKIGEFVWQTHSIPRSDFFSFTTGGHSWIAHEWLAQLTIYGAWRLGGYTGLMLWLCILPSLLFILLYGLCSLYSGNAKVSLLGGMSGWLFATVGLAIRPLVIGNLFLVLELILIHLARTRSRRWLWALPPLFAVWINCHGSYMLGLMVMGLLFCCSFFEISMGSLTAERWTRDFRRAFVVAGVLCVGALFVNPVGIRLVVYPFDLLLHQSHNVASVAEWQPMDPSDGRAWALFGIAGIVFVTALLQRGKLRLEELALLALGMGMAIWHQRMFFIFGILSAPLLCRLLAGSWERYEPAKDHRVWNAMIMFAVIIGIVSTFPNGANLQNQVNKSNPVKAVAFIKQTGLQGPMLNEYDFGGYLIWALPERKVFIDGRADVYDWTGVFSELGRWALLQEDPTILLKKYGINFCLLRKSAPMARVLPYLPGWKEVYADEMAVIFARDSSGAR